MWESAIKKGAWEWENLSNTKSEHKGTGKGGLKKGQMCEEERGDNKEGVWDNGLE